MNTTPGAFINEWFILVEGKTHGPFNDAALKKFANSGKIAPETPLRKGTDGQWTKCGKLKGLFTSIATSPEQKKSQTVNAVINNAQFYVSEPPKELAPASRRVPVVKIPEATTNPPALNRNTPQKTSLAPSAPAQETQAVVQQKNCPFCDELIAVLAVKCRHCNEFLDPALRMASAPAQQAQPIFNNVMQAPAPIIINNNNNNNVMGHELTPRWNPLVAALLSFVLPGVGQIYKGQPFNGILWFVVVIIGYAAFVVPGVVLHLLCVCGAAMGDPYRR